MIHPTAIVDSKAELAEDAEVGPYSVIGADVKIGAGTVIHSHVTLAGPTTIGEGNTFFPYASVGQRSQDLKYEGEPTYLEIGDRNVFREFVTVNRGTLPGTKTIVGSDNKFLAYSHIAHDCIVEDHCIFSNNGTLAGHVYVESYAILGGLTAIHQFCRVGKHAITGGCSKIVQDIPPFMIADGNEARIRGVNEVGLERRGFSKESIKALRKCWSIIWRKNLNVSDALEKIRAEFSGPEVSELLAFIEASNGGVETRTRRGIIR